MINTTLEILTFPEGIPHDLKENQTNRVTLLSRRFSGCQLEVSIEENGHLRGQITTNETIEEVKLRGLPTHLNLKRTTQLLKQSYLKFQKGAIEVLPKGLGGGKKHTTGSATTLESNQAKTCEEEVLQIERASLSDIDSLIEAIVDEMAKRIIRKAVEELLKDDPKKNELVLTSNQIDTSDAQGLSVLPQINQTLDLEGFWLYAECAQALAVALQVNQSLQTLNLNKNNFYYAGAQALAVALQINQSLQILNFEDNNIMPEGAQAIGDALKVNHTLQTLSLSSNQIGDVGAKALGIALQVNQSIQKLELAGNEIGDAGAQALGAALQGNQSLQILNLAYNLISVEGAKVLAAGFQVNYTIQTLNLAENEIGTAGAQALGKALQVNHTLQVLDLCNNQIGDEGAQALGAALQVNQWLQRLNLARNQISAMGAQALGIALQINQSLQSLRLEYNQIGDASAQTLKDALQVNHTLQSLCLFGNQIGNESAQALIAALQLNHTLQVLIVEDSQISDAGTKKQIYTLTWANKQIATLFQQKIKEVQMFLQSHENDEGIPLQNLPQLQELLQKWYTDSKNIISSLEKILIESGRKNLNDRYRKKLEGIITDLTNRLHDLCLESFEKKVVALSNEYVMGKEPSEECNVDLGYALYETWLTFLGSDCPDWVEDHIQSLIPFSVLLDIAEGGGKQDITDLTDAHLLFQRVLSFSNESKDLPYSLTTHS